VSKAHTNGIAEVNGDLHAVLEINPDALAIATKRDAERSNGAIRDYVFVFK
jgi:amidase